MVHTLFTILLTLNRKFLRPSPSAITDLIHMIQRCSLDFLSQNAFGDRPAFWIFQGFTDRALAAIQLFRYSLS